MPTDDEMLMSAAPAGPWEPDWFGAATPASMEAWRCVECQSDIATLKLVDTREEHEALEEMLEGSKPPLASGSEGLHYLLFTPFRYNSLTPTRFRVANDPGIWYGGDCVPTVLAECAYWRIKFIRDSAGLSKGDGAVLTTKHTVFAADVQGLVIDLTVAPWSSQAATWKHPTDYAGTQALGREARRQDVEWIRYESVRHPGATCAAVLNVAGLAATKPRGEHEWACRASRDNVIFYNRELVQTLSWDA
jgi:hypothetical protein